MARNRKTGQKKRLKRIRELEREIASRRNPPSNPKAATALWQMRRELNRLKRLEESSTSSGDKGTFG
jgi:hypothetical protein